MEQHGFPFVRQQETPVGVHWNSAAPTFSSSAGPQSAD